MFMETLHLLVYHCIRRFKDGRYDLEDDSRGGRPLSKNAQNIEFVRNLVEEDQ